ncbi:hypothetical protein niasHT_007629 [Heterodera trifolii]|uniref:Myb-like domain-containing protein n=1 Tax=Heterodera trifolii TaxID=157864 RepID=A0ABD2LPR8_9BILA
MSFVATAMAYRKVGAKYSKLEWQKKCGEEEERQRIRAKVVDGVGDTYKFVERRELTVRDAEDLPMLSGGIYAAQLLKMSREAEPMPDELEDNGWAEGGLKLPPDGGIFHDGIPFHHFSLTALKPKHIRRLKKNGIELKQNAFSHAEDQQIRENWLSFAEAHQLEEDEAPRMVSAATATETREAHRERIRFIRSTLFRPWMCSRLLDRTAGQVFRRCYHIYRVSSLDNQAEMSRIWTSAEDVQLLELYKQHGPKWEFIGNEMLRVRYDCRRRHAKLMGGEGEGEEMDIGKGGRRNGTNQNGTEGDGGTMAGTSKTDGTEDDDDQWSRTEIARLYEYLCDHLPRMPVLVALVPRYQNMDSEVNWADPSMRLSGRSVAQRREKWEQLKEAFRSARDGCDQSARVKHILRTVLPEDTRILARARVERKRKTKAPPPLSPADHAKWVDKMREFCEENSVEQPKDIDKTKLKQKLKSSGVLLNYSFRAIWRRFRMMLFVGRTAGLFKMLPIDEDKLVVHLRLLVFLLQQIQCMSVRKRTLRKYTRRFLRISGWPRRERVVLVDKAMPGDISDEKMEQIRTEEQQKKVTFR